jgi:aminopeptidase N
MISQASFALSTAADAMDFYEEFFGVPYPLPKQGKLLNFVMNETCLSMKNICNR